VALGIFALADVSEARLLAKAAYRGDIPGTVVLERMNLIDLVTLAGVIDPSYDRISALRPAIRVSSGAAVPVAEQLKLRLSQLQPYEIGSLAEAWAQAEEFRGLIAAAELSRFLEAIAKLATEGVEIGRPLLFLNI